MLPLREAVVAVYCVGQCWNGARTTPIWSGIRPSNETNGILHDSSLSDDSLLEGRINLIDM